MKVENLAKALEGWNTVEDVCQKLHIKRNSAYTYLYLLHKNGFVVQKVKKPRGTMYEIHRIPIGYKNLGMYSGTDLVATEQEFTKHEISSEQKLAFFLSRGSIRTYNEALKFVPKIRNWKLLYKYLKAYGIKQKFTKLYTNARLKFKRLPSIPKRYKKLLGV